MRQLVKTYHNQVANFRINKKEMNITEQINLDLKLNTDWSIHILQYIHDGDICTVVYNIREEKQTNEFIAESNDIKIENSMSDYTTSPIIKNANTKNYSVE